jgi:hypothetical protein
MTALAALEIFEPVEAPELAAAPGAIRALPGEPPEALDACPQCGHPAGPGRHDRYGSHCRATFGRDECKCQGPLTRRGRK